MRDSIMNGSNAGNFAYSFSPKSVGTTGDLYTRPDSFANGRPGNTSGNMMARISTSLGCNPQGMVLLAGMNNAAQVVPLATRISNMRGLIS